MSTSLRFPHMGRQMVSAFEQVTFVWGQDRPKVGADNSRWSLTWPSVHYFSWYVIMRGADITIDHGRKVVHREHQEQKVLLRISASVRCSIPLSSSWDANPNLDSGIPESTLFRTFSSSASFWTFRIVSSWSDVLNSYFHLVHLKFCELLNQLFSRITGWSQPFLLIEADAASAVLGVVGRCK